MCFSVLYQYLASVFCMFRQFDLLRNLVISLTFRIQENNKCMLHEIVRAYIVFMQNHLHAQFTNVFDVCNLHIGYLS